MVLSPAYPVFRPSRPTRGAWIEIAGVSWQSVGGISVAPHKGRVDWNYEGESVFNVLQRSCPTRGRWIEMPTTTSGRPLPRSRPPRGTRIETSTAQASMVSRLVLPHMGRWIELRSGWPQISARCCRAPRGVRGLKLSDAGWDAAPFASCPARGAWIKTACFQSSARDRRRRALHGVCGLKSELGRDPCRDYGLTSFVVCGNRRTDKKQTAPERICKRILSGAVILYLRKSKVRPVLPAGRRSRGTGCPRRTGHPPAGRGYPASFWLCRRR